MVEDIIKPVGEITIKDIETGEIVYQTHNMIVKEGRQIIHDQIFGGDGSTFTKFYPYFETIGSSVSEKMPPDITIDDIYKYIIVVKPDEFSGTFPDNTLDYVFSFILNCNMVTSASTNPIITQIGLISSSQKITDWDEYKVTSDVSPIDGKQYYVCDDNGDYEIAVISNNEFTTGTIYYEYEPMTIQTRRYYEPLFIKTKDIEKLDGKTYYTYDSDTNTYTSIDDDTSISGGTYYEKSTGYYVLTEDSNPKLNKTYYTYDESTNEFIESQIVNSQFSKYDYIIKRKTFSIKPANTLLFSRAPIDEFYLRSGRSYEVTYKIKF